VASKILRYQALLNHQRFGFRSYPDLKLEGVPQEYILTLPFAENRAQGFIVHHKGFFCKGLTEWILFEEDT
jgi:hypothetical protein